MGAEKNGDSSSSSSSTKPRTVGGSSRLLFYLIALCMLSAVVNIVFTHQHHDEATTAVHDAMQDFILEARDRVDTHRREDEEQLRQKAQKEKQEKEKLQQFHQDKELDEKISHDESNRNMHELSCKAFGGPSDEAAQEMVYWSHIPSDTKYISPFHAKQGQAKRYMTFEPDGGGWNNIRMAMETVLGLAIATGRTLVLPPEQRMYLLAKNRGKDKTDFGFADFFPMAEMARENDGLEMITTQEFLETVAMTGQLRDKYTGEVSFPPENRTDWNGEDVKPLKEWLRNATHTPLWGPDDCLAAFPASGDHKDVEALKQMQETINQQGQVHLGVPIKDPIPVDATPIERMRENLAGRKQICVYDGGMQEELVVHFMCYHKMRVRMLVHFYAFLFFEDWRADVWMKRFMRDHVRYIDEIQCAAARIVDALRQHARSRDPIGNPNGDFDTFHVRRGDFQYKRTRIDAVDIHKNTKAFLSPNATIYIATDERDKKFFDPLKQHYDVLFMDDFMHLLKNVNTNYFGMIDQLVASRGRLFFGCWHSTFTGFIHRIRGYHSVKDKAPGSELGLLPNSYYYVPESNRDVMHQYYALHHPFFSREFPTSWRNIDFGVGNLPNVLQQ